MLLSAAGRAEERPAVDWYVFDFPPIYILSGPDTGKGTADARLRQFMAGLDEFQNRKVVASPSRLMADMAVKDGVCSITMLRTPEREAALIYAQHFWRLETSRVMLRPDRQDLYARFMTADGRIDLAAMLNDAELTGVFVAKRSYTGAIDRYVREQSGRQDRLLQVNSSESAFRMLELGRADYTFGYGYELRYFNDTQREALKLASVAAVGDPLYVDGGIACSKGPVSTRVISAIDALLDRQPTTDEIGEASRRWRGAVEVETEPRLFTVAPAVTN
ncbi:TIGR02285 family protein [Radicibacter daui]|uniref:TIGR02285 family protein n=1 Tax=Radicibacter daui TaxID=3064829 RepID=UPI004046E865